MAVNIDGKACRTLRDPVYLDGKLIKEIYVDGTLVYPDKDYDGLPSGRYVLRLRSQYSHVFSSIEMTKTGDPGGLLSDAAGNEYDVFTRMVVGDVEAVVVSEVPISVYEGHVPFPTSEFESYYRCGTTHRKSDVYDWENNRYYEYVTAAPFPDTYASVGYKTNGLTYVCYRARGFNTASSMDGWRASGALAWVWKDGGRTDLAIEIARGKTASKGYYESSDDEDMIRVDEVRSSMSVDGQTYGNLVCGYSASVSLPVISTAIWAASHEGTHTKPFYIAPFTEILYNNNPPVTSPTFADDPPTEEADDSWKVAP